MASANVSDNQAGCRLLDRLEGKVPRLALIAADHGYKTTFIDYAHHQYGWPVEIAQKPESGCGFVPDQKRWPVERSFGWLNFKRRLVRAFEKTIESSPGRRGGSDVTNWLYFVSYQQNCQIIIQNILLNNS